MKISIIVPVYNERKTIKQVIDRLLNLKFNKEIIVVVFLPLVVFAGGTRIATCRNCSLFDRFLAPPRTI